jgi:hypothetical protein
MDNSHLRMIILNRVVKYAFFAGKPHIMQQHEGRGGVAGRAPFALQQVVLLEGRFSFSRPQRLIENLRFIGVKVECK